MYRALVLVLALLPCTGCGLVMVAPSQCDWPLAAGLEEAPVVALKYPLGIPGLPEAVQESGAFSRVLVYDRWSPEPLEQSYHLELRWKAANDWSGSFEGTPAATFLPGVLTLGALPIVACSEYALELEVRDTLGPRGTVRVEDELWHLLWIPLLPVTIVGEADPTDTCDDLGITYTARRRHQEELQLELVRRSLREAYERGLLGFDPPVAEPR